MTFGKVKPGNSTWVTAFPGSKTPKPYIKSHHNLFHHSATYHTDTSRVKTPFGYR